MWESIFSFLGPILQSALGSAASTGISSLMNPSPRHEQQQPQAPQAAPAATTPVGGTPGVSGAGSSTSPTGGLSFGGGFTGGPDPRDMASSNPAGSPAGPSIPSSGFQTMGYPKTDQTALRQGLRGI